MQKRFMSVSLLSIALAGTLLTGCGSSNESSDKQQASTPQNDQQQSAQAKEDGKYTKPPEMKIDKNKEYTATIQTNKGDIKIKLFDNEAPITVNNFVFLARDKFYDNVKFHRVIKEFMIQTGDPLGNGRGGPGYRFQDELPPVKPYAKGIVAMANAGQNTNGSQFFIGSGDQVANLNQQPNYTVFGEVVEGMDTVDKIASVKVEASETGEPSAPVEDVHINTVTIEEK
ncbi:MAG: peptidylprolyl isomerase [Tumebacillaceae bacterium]